MKMEQSVPKRRHINSRRRVITQKKAYKCKVYFQLTLGFVSFSKNIELFADFFCKNAPSVLPVQTTDDSFANTTG